MNVQLSGHYELTTVRHGTCNTDNHLTDFGLDCIAGKTPTGLTYNYTDPETGAVIALTPRYESGFNTVAVGFTNQDITQANVVLTNNGNEYFAVSNSFSGPTNTQKVLSESGESSSIKMDFFNVDNPDAGIYNRRWMNYTFSVGAISQRCNVIAVGQKLTYTNSLKKQITVFLVTSIAKITNRSGQVVTTDYDVSDQLFVKWELRCYYPNYVVSQPYTVTYDDIEYQYTIAPFALYSEYDVSFLINTRLTLGSTYEGYNATRCVIYFANVLEKNMPSSILHDRYTNLSGNGDEQLVCDRVGTLTSPYVPGSFKHGLTIKIDSTASTISREYNCILVYTPFGHFFIRFNKPFVKADNMSLSWPMTISWGRRT